MKIGPSAMDLLTHYRWPGNVRQLENSLERAVLVCTGNVIGPEHLPDLVEERKVAEASAAGADELVTPRMTLREAETALLIQALDESGGNRTAAAENLGITTRTLRNKLHRLGMMDYMRPGDGNGKDFPPRGEKEIRLDPVPAESFHGGDRFEVIPGVSFICPKRPWPDLCGLGPWAEVRPGLIAIGGDE